MEGRTAALGEAAYHRREDKEGRLRGTCRARKARRGRGLPEPQHRRGSEEEQGNEAKGGGGGESSIRPQEVMRSLSSKRSCGEEWARPCR